MHLQILSNIHQEYTITCNPQDGILKIKEELSHLLNCHSSQIILTTKTNKITLNNESKICDYNLKDNDFILANLPDPSIKTHQTSEPISTSPNKDIQFKESNTDFYNESFEILSPLLPPLNVQENFVPLQNSSSNFIWKKKLETEAKSNVRKISQTLASDLILENELEDIEDLDQLITPSETPLPKTPKKKLKGKVGFMLVEENAKIIANSNLNEPKTQETFTQTSHPTELCPDIDRYIGPVTNDGIARQQNLEDILSMGFDENTANQALNLTNNNKEAAIEYILTGYNGEAVALPADYFTNKQQTVEIGARLPDSYHSSASKNHATGYPPSGQPVYESPDLYPSPSISEHAYVPKKEPLSEANSNFVLLKNQYIIGRETLEFLTPFLKSSFFQEVKSKLKNDGKLPPDFFESIEKNWTVVFAMFAENPELLRICLRETLIVEMQFGDDLDLSDRNVIENVG